MNPPLPAVCDWCDNPPVVSHPELGNLCRGCLTGPDTRDDDGDDGDGHHYQLRHEPFLAACFAARSAAEALERLRGYLDTNTARHKYGPVIDAAIHDGTADILIEQGVCVPLGGDENVQLTCCFCDDLTLE